MARETVFPLPITIEEIDAGWLTAALRTRAPDVTVHKVETVDVKPGTCTKIRLRLDLNDAGKAAGIPQLVILKGGFETHSRTMSHVHLSEVRGYRDVFPVLGLPTPACYFADYDEAHDQGIVIMQDLVEIGVEFCSALKPQSFKQVAKRLAVLAKFHAQTWDSAGPAQHGRWAGIPEGEVFLRSYMNQYLEKPLEWERFVASPRGAATSVRFHNINEIIKSFDRLTEFSRRLPHSIIHGDTHPNNLFIFADGSPGFFDGLPSQAPVMKEIAYHITCALDTADRRRWEGPLVGLYLDELRRHGIEPPDFDEAMLQYGAFLLDGHIIFMVNESFYQPEAINTAYTARFSAAMIDHRTLELLAEVA